MLSIAQLRKGVTLVYNGAPYQVLESTHTKLGRGGGIQQIKMQNLLDGAVINHNFKGNERLEEAQMRNRTASFLYNDAKGWHFMDAANYDQYILTQEKIGTLAKWLKDGMAVSVRFFADTPIAVSLPTHIEVVVSEAEPGLKGDRANPGTKPALTDTGATINVPLFIQTGAKIIVDTRIGEYVKRA